MGQRSGREGSLIGFCGLCAAFNTFDQGKEVKRLEQTIERLHTEEQAAETELTKLSASEARLVTAIRQREEQLAQLDAAVAQRREEEARMEVELATHKQQLEQQLDQQLQSQMHQSQESVRRMIEQLTKRYEAEKAMFDNLQIDKAGVRCYRFSIVFSHFYFLSQLEQKITLLQLQAQEEQQKIDAKHEERMRELDAKAVEKEQFLSKVRFPTRDSAIWVCLTSRCPDCAKHQRSRGGYL